MSRCRALADDKCYDKAQSQSKPTDCSQADLKQSDDKLNRPYREMEGRLKGDDDTKKLLIDAQKKWVAFHDAECTFSTVRTAGGNINPMNVNICASALTDKRSQDFEDYLKCSKASKTSEDAEDCAFPGPS